MKKLPIRARLTVWYLVVLSITLLIFSVGMYLAMRSTLHAAIDDELKDRAEGVHAFLWRHLPWQSGQTLLREFQEHSGVRPGGDLYQVVDAQGHWVYQSPSIRQLNIPPEAPQATPQSHYEMLERQRQRLRILAASMEVAHQKYSVQVASVVSPFYSVLDRFKWIALFASPIIVLLSGLGGYWLSKRAMTPVDEITSAAQQISGQNLSRRLSIPESRDELRRLSETLNEMLSRLESAFKRVTQFTADASHELRTPVAIIRTTVEYLQQNKRSVAEYEEANAHILAEAELTSTLLENLMTLARADSDTTNISFLPVDLCEVIRHITISVGALIEAKKLLLSTSIPSNPVTVLGDKQAIRRLILILIDNAIKYTAPEGHISVSVKAREGYTVAEVLDSGTGISTDDLPHIFERFYRADKVRSREMGGAGLGLSIAKWIADAHHAQIEVESKLNEGSLFRVTFAKASQVAREEPENQQRLII